MNQVNLEKMQELNFRTNEAYKSIRTNIQFCGSNIKLICLTSCLPNEGKSTVSFNLASSFAEAGRSVIYVDADLRRSITLGRYKPDQPVLGLTHYLSGQNTIDEILYSTNNPNLDMIFTGPVPPNPAELLGSEAFSSMIHLLKEEYDYVIIDTPPLGSVIDSAIVAQLCDGVVFVIEANAISYKVAQRVVSQLRKGNCKILGAVLNKVAVKSRQYRYYEKKYKKYYLNYNTGH